MNKILIMIFGTALLVSGCGDKDDSATGQNKPSAVEQAMESAGDAVNDAADAAGTAMDGAADAVSDAANDVADGAGKMASDATASMDDAVGGAADEADKMASDMTDTATATATAAVAASGMTDGGAAGQQVYQKSCQACHATGVAGAPKVGDKDAWAPRIAIGMDALVASAIGGKGVMPPKGTCAGCSDADLKAAVEYMVSQSK